MQNSKSIFSIVLILLPTVILGALAMDIYAPCIPFMPQALHTDQYHVQLTIGIFIAGTGFGQILYGPFIDRFGRKTTMLIGMIIYLLASLACCLVTNINHLILARLLQSLGACGSSVAAFTMVKDIVHESDQPKVYSYLSGAIGLAPILAPILGGYLLVWFGSWRSSFIFLVAFSCISLLYLALKLQETQIASEKMPISLEIFARYGQIIKDKKFIVYSLCSAVGMTVLVLFFSMSSILLIDKLEVKSSHYGYFFGLNAIMFTIGNFLSPRITGKLGINQIVTLGCSLLTLAGGIMLILAWQFGLGIINFMAPMFLASFGVGLILGPTTSGALENFKAIAGTAASLQGFIRFTLPAIISAIIMRVEVVSTLPLAYSMLVLGLFSVIISHLHKQP